MARLSRTESQAQTRELLIKTARELFFTLGYVQTSLEKVAEAAGFSKGAVYSNFKNKDELCTAVLEQVRGERTAEIIAIATRPDPEQRIAEFTEWARRVIGDPYWTSLEVEYMAQARRNEDQRKDLAARLDSVISLLTGAIDTLPADSDRLPNRELAITFLALGVGLGLFRTVDPEIPVDGLIDTMRTLVLDKF